jgi:hypothetical protein
MERGLLLNVAGCGRHDRVRTYSESRMAYPLFRRRLCHLDTAMTLWNALDHRKYYIWMQESGFSLLSLMLLGSALSPFLR